MSDQEDFFAGLDTKRNTEVNPARARRHGHLPQPHDVSSGDWIRNGWGGNISLLAAQSLSLNSSEDVFREGGPSPET